ncbi:MAG: PD-(D/E)XK nuclease family protein, partial [Oscillospiraceae bacterium]|nr:PD-(D/E)XK nuclease family protein [Oscillospiraceae bacterium]
LSGWLRYLDHLAENEDAEDFTAKNPLTSNFDSVSVKTIHKAKGLEYPFIFIANLDRLFSQNRPKSGTDCVLAEESGLLGLRMLDQKQYLKIKTVAFTYLDIIRSLREKHEEMRLLYVAMTRAKQQLFLVLDNSAMKSKNLALIETNPEIMPKLAREAKSMQDWLVWFLYSVGQGDFIRDVFSGNGQTSELANYIVWNPDKQIQTAPDPEQHLIIPQAEPDPATMTVIRKQLDFAYHSAQAVLPAKYSVTELSHEENEIQIHDPEFLTQEDKIRKLHGKARGTAIHKMMQFMDFQKAEQDLTAELERIEEKGCLTHLEVRALRTEKLRTFFKSAIYQRISASDHVEKEKQLFIRIADLALPEESEFARNYQNTDGVIIGTVDLLFHEPDGWVILDYKTDQSQPAEELLRKYSKQLGFYQKAMERILGEPVKQAYIYYFTEDQTLEVDLSQIKY